MEPPEFGKISVENVGPGSPGLSTSLAYVTASDEEDHRQWNECLTIASLHFTGIQYIVQSYVVDCVLLWMGRVKISLLNYRQCASADCTTMLMVTA